MNTKSDRATKLSPLRVRLLTIFAGLCAALVIVILGINTYSGYRTSIEVAHDMFALQSDRIIEKTMSYLGEAEQSAHIMSRHATAGQLPITKSRDEIVDYATQLLWAYPSVSGIYYGDAYGLWGACEEEDGLLNMVWRWKEDLSTDVSRGKYIFVNRDGERQGEKIFQDTWNTLLRPWYIKSRGVPKPYWSDPYVFITDKAEVGISAVHDVHTSDGAVTGITVTDITLGELSRFLREHAVGKTGMGLIMDEDGTIVCMPDIEDAVLRTEAGGLSLRNIADLKKFPYLIQAFTQNAKTGDLQMRVSEDGVNYLVTFADFPDSFGRPWRLVMAADEAEFVSTTKRNALISAVISGVLLLLAIPLIFMISRKISLPLVRLAEETERIRNLELDGDISIVSRIHEVDMIATAVSRLKTGLRAFQKYVPSGLVKELVRTGEDARLGGRLETLTLFFTDIAGFTSICEYLAPEYVNLHLSDYLDELTRIIQDSGGTVDKYVGDGIVAFWGAPVQDPQQEVNACRAAVLCQRRLAELNASWQSRGKPMLPTRIGIHTGRTLVGNIGAEDRMNYTVLGDSVNVASRLEGANKVFGSSVLVSESTFSKLGAGFIGRPLDYIVVKGKSEHVKVYELMALNDEMASEEDRALCVEFTATFDLFMTRRWDDALEKAAAILSKYPDDVASLQLRNRCLKYRTDPPPEDWDGYCGEPLTTK